MRTPARPRAKVYQRAKPCPLCHSPYKGLHYYGCESLYVKVKRAGRRNVQVPRGACQRCGHPKDKHHDRCERNPLGSWQLLRRYELTCEACDVTHHAGHARNGMSRHHLYGQRFPFLIVVLCRQCHDQFHYNTSMADLESGRYDTLDKVVAAVKGEPHG